MESFMNSFHVYSKKLIFSFFLKEEKDWELMTSLSSELKNLGPWKKGENFLVFVRARNDSVLVIIFFNASSFSFCYIRDHSQRDLDPSGFHKNHI